MKIEIVKFFLYPKDEPTGYAVGFNITTNNDRTFYTDTIIPLASCTGLDDTGIADLAWEELEPQVNAKVAELELLSPIIGGEWTPSKYVTETEQVTGAPPPFPGE